MAKKSKEWSVVVDDARRFRMLESASAAYDNACSLLADAKVLFSAERFSRAGALAILAEEEYAKALVLCICARDRRWDSAILDSLTRHPIKQAVSQGMVEYWDWLQINLRRVTALNRGSLIGAQPAVFPSEREWNEIVEKSRLSNIKERQRDKLKQQLIYLDVGEEGQVMHRPAVLSSSNIASGCIDTAATFKVITDHALADQIPGFAPSTV